MRDTGQRSMARGGRNGFVCVCGLVCCLLLLTSRPAAAQAPAASLPVMQTLTTREIPGLLHPVDVAVSPEGAHVYVACERSDTVLVFRREPESGRLEVVDSLQRDDAEWRDLSGPTAITVAPGGSHVYLLCRFANAVLVTARDPATGALSHVETLRNEEGAPAHLATPSSLWCTPDGLHAYVVNEDLRNLLHFARDQNSGVLRFQDAVEEFDRLGLPASGPLQLRFLPGGRELAVGRRTAAQAKIFTRNPATGELSFLETRDLQDELAAQFAQAGYAELASDGRHLYATGDSDASIRIYRLDHQTGLVALIQTFDTRTEDEPDKHGARSVVAAPDGTALYVSSQFGAPLTVFDIDPVSGAAAYRTHVSLLGPYGDRLRGLRAVAPSPDGAYLYLAAQFSGAVDVLAFDADRDGLADAFEGDADSDGDGTPNRLDADSDENGVLDTHEGLGDLDADGEPDAFDRDDDDDGLPDVDEGPSDADHDGLPNHRDTDSDNNGADDREENGQGAPGGSTRLSMTDTDGDGAPDFQDLDDDNDGIPDTVEGNDDLDGDGQPNRADLDSDGDRIADADVGAWDLNTNTVPDFRESATLLRALLDRPPSDSPDANARAELGSLLEPAPGESGAQPLADTHGLLQPSQAFLDRDNDSDGIPNGIEGFADPDFDGIPACRDNDSDGNGVPDRIELADDLDGDGVPDFVDADNDGDGIPDAIEGADDPDGDGLPNYNDTDSDGNNVPDAQEGTRDSDGDGAPDFLDSDNDGDAIPDLAEGVPTGSVAPGAATSNGSLLLVQTVADTAEEGAQALFAGAIDLALSPGASRLYLACYEAGAVAEFARDPATGQLTLLRTLQAAEVGETPLPGARALALDPSGQFLYAVGREAGTLLAIRVAP